MAEDVVQRRLAAILAGDMVGYSRLMELDEAGTVARQKACLDELINPKIKEFGGRLVKTTGDGVLVEFPSSVNAVLCAVSVQREMVAREASVPEDRRIAYRIGINVGEIIFDGDDIFGDGVNVAARLEALAEPGGVHISETVFNNVKGKLDLGFADLGALKVKNIAEPVPAFQVLLNPDDVGKVIQAAPALSARSMSLIGGAVAVVLLAIAAYFFTSQPAGIADPVANRLLVLPFRALNEDAEPYADAVSENLWLTLARVKGTTMVPRTRAIDFKGMDPSRDQIAGNGKITHILDGTVTTEGDEVIVKGRLRQLSETSETVIWEQDARGSTSNVFEGLVRQKLGVMSAMNVPLNASERRILEQTYTRNIKAFLLFAEAESLWETQHWTKVRPAIELFEAASKLDPDFIEARTGIAWLKYFAWSENWNIAGNTLEAVQDAERIADDILKSDPLNTQALSVKILITVNRLQREEALALAQGAVFQNADDPVLRSVLGFVLTANAKYDEARAEIDKAVELSPRLRVRDITGLAYNYLKLGDAERALAVLSQAEADGPKNVRHLWLRAEAYSSLGRMEEGESTYQQLLQSWPPANLKWSEVKFRVFKDPAVFEDYAMAMQKLGLPLWPFNITEGKDDDRLDGAALSDLFRNSLKLVDTVDPLGKPYQATYFADGTFDLHFDFIPDFSFRGTWEISGNEICFQEPKTWMGRKFCWPMYIDREKSTDEDPRFLLVGGFGVYKFGVEYIDN